MLVATTVGYDGYLYSIAVITSSVAAGTGAVGSLARASDP